MAYFVFKLNKIRILKNREFGKAEAKIISLITTDDIALPNLDELASTNDMARRLEITKAVIQTVISARVLTEVKHVKDGHIFFFGDTGYALYTSKTIPESLNWSLTVMESDRDVQFWGEKLEAIVEDPKLDTFAKNLATLVRAATSPLFAAGVEVSKFVLGCVAKILKENKNDQLAILYQSFNRYEHYPHGERKKDNVPDISNNALVDYSIFGVD